MDKQSSDNGEDFDLSIIIVAWNTKELIDECLTALRNSNDSFSKQILFVDNGSSDGTVEFVREHYPEVELICSETNLGFTRANNLAYEKVRGKYVLMLNSDAFVSKDTIRQTIGFMEENSDCGVVGARLIGRDGVLQPCVRNFPTPFRLFLRNQGLEGKIPYLAPLDDFDCDFSQPQECDWVVGCFLLVRKSIIDEMDFFLRDSFFMYNDDNDLCLRIKRKGWKVYYFPTDVIHVGGATAAKMGIVSTGNQIDSLQIESQFIYFRSNYSLAVVLMDYILSVFSGLIGVLKCMLKFHSIDSCSNYISRFFTTTYVLWKTAFGKKAIH